MASRIAALRLVLLGVLVSWLWKYRFWALAMQLYVERPFDDPFFPPVMQRFEVFFAAFLVPMLASAGALCVASAGSFALALLCCAVGSLLLLLHQQSYNDATFVTTLWVSLWGIWLFVATRPVTDETSDSARAGAIADGLFLRASMLAQCMIALWFFGGAVGKCTPGYLDGQVLYDIYFRDRAYWSFEWARQLFQGEQLHLAARWYSRIVFAMEWLLATLPLWRVVPAMTFALLAMGSIVVLNNYYLFSVFAAPMAMCGVVLMLTRASSARPQADG